MKRKSNIIFLSLPFLVWSIACFVFFQYFYKFHLFHRLDIQLFLYTKEYILSYFTKPAWSSSLAGDFFSQFFFFNNAGAFVLTISILMTGFLFFLAIEKLFQPKTKSENNSIRWICLVISLILMTWEVLRNCGMSYKLGSTLSIAGGLALYFIYTSFRFRYRWLIALPLIPFAYWSFGYGAFFLFLLVLITEISERHFLQLLLIIAVFLFFPLTTRTYYGLTISQAYQYPSTAFWDKPDYKKEEMLKIDALGNMEQWGQVAKLTEQYDTKSQFITYYFNLSHGILGNLSDKLSDTWLAGPKGLLLQLNVYSSFLAIWSSNEAWFQLGDMTLAEHSTLLGMIFSPEHRSVRMVKRMAEINLVNADTIASMKYLRMLEKTWLYRSWAEERIPGKETPEVKHWLQEKRTFIPKSDTLRDALNPSLSLRGLLDSNKKNKLALDYLLCYDLLAKDIQSFMNDYNKYKFSKDTYPGRLYSEALLIGLSQQQATADEVKPYNISSQVYTDFSDYTKLYQESMQNNTNLISRFQQTYWFYFHFAKFK